MGELNDEKVIILLSRFYRDTNYLSLKRLYKSKSFPEILSVGRREMCHSAFWAWLLNSNESHELDVFPFLQFLKILVRRDIMQGINRHHEKGVINTCTDSIASSVMNEQLSLGKMHVDVEKTDSKSYGRFDIKIDVPITVDGKDLKLHMVIENKVYSNEQNDQTSNYFKSFNINNQKKQKSNDHLYLLVYLTPLSKGKLDNLQEPQCICKRFIQINYQDLLDEILEPALDKSISSKTRFIIDEYIHCLGMPSIDEQHHSTTKKKKYQPYTIMATSSKVSEMLKIFWETNQDLLLAVMNNIANDDNQDSDVRDKAEDFFNVVNVHREKDKTHYCFDGDLANGKFALVRMVVKKAIEKGINPEKISKEYKDTLEPLKKKSLNAVYKELKATIEKEGLTMTCLNEKDLFDPNKIGTSDLVYNADNYQKWRNSQKTKKEIHKRVNDIYIMNQWSFSTIDYFIYVFLKRKDEWNLGDSSIKVIK